MAASAFITSSDNPPAPDTAATAVWLQTTGALLASISAACTAGVACTISMTMPSRFSGWMAGLIAVAGGVWLVIGPSLHPVWSSHMFAPLPDSEWMTAARWIGFFYGAGALAIYLGAHAKGLLERRSTTVVAREARTGDAPPVVERRVADDGTVVERPAADQPTRVERP